MGVYYVEGKGWRYHFKHKGIRYTKAWFKTKREALDEESKRRKEIKNQVLIELEEKKCSILFWELIEKRLEYVKAHNSKIYYEAYRFMAARWVRKWSEIPCEQITRNMVEEHILERSKISNHAANKDIRYLKAVFGWGIEQEIINGNPAAKVKKLPIEKRKKYIPPKEDVWKVLLAATPDVQDYLWTIILTLARVGEINHLTWDDVDFENRCITLYTRKKKGGDLTGRRIHMTDRLHEILFRRYKARDKTKPWVFWQRYWNTTTGEMMESPFIYRHRILQTLCKKVEVKDFRFHALRHFGASVLKNAGVPETAIQGNLGHEKLSTTHLYLQSIGEAEKDAIIILEKELNGEVVDNSKSAHTGCTQNKEGSE